MTGRGWIACGAFLGGLAVLAGAFGAHGLEDYLTAHERTATFETAVRYQMYHALGIVLVGILAERRPAKFFTVAGWCFLGGSVLFCGALYGIALADIPRLGMIAPIGGALLILGWVALFIGALRTDR